MEKTLSLIALVFAVSLAACQQQPVNAPTPAPIESPIQQAAPTPVEPVKTPVVAEPVKKKLGKNSATKTPRLDDAIRRIERLEKLARQYGVPL